MAIAVERLSLFFSVIILGRVARRELKNREAPSGETSYEARKRRLLVSLRHKISEKKTRIN